MRTRTERDERGAAAIVFAISAIMIFGLAAIGVDLGNAMNRDKQVQTNADLAALAGADGLPSTGTATVQAVADYLNKNQPRDDTDAENKCDPSTGAITAAQLQDGNGANGEVTFPTTTRMKVIAPSRRVNFGMASALGFKATCVSGNATVRIASGGIGLAPYYATNTCSSGPQIMKSDAGGPSIPFTVPVLSHDTETNNSDIYAINPTQIPLATDGAPDGPQLTVTGTNLAAPAIDRVGFFNSDQAEPVQATPLLTPAQTASDVTVNVPNAVAKVQDVWWVRVHNSVTNQWSPRSEARPLLVGEAVLSCDAASVSGNFGSIDIPWTNNPNTNIDLNIKDGLPPGVTLAKYPGPPYPADNDCDNGPPGVISTLAVRREGTNCVNTTTGLRAGPAYDGYLKNPDGKLKVDTSALCQSQGRPARGPLNENADLLTCFLKNNTLRLSDTTYYNGTDALFVQDIWNSPRFTLIPILDHDPSGTKYLPILRFVAGFITDQVTGASRGNPIESGQTTNGLVVQGSQLRAIRIYYFSLDALPPPPDGSPLMDYVGDGKKITTLVN